MRKMTTKLDVGQEIEVEYLGQTIKAWIKHISIDYNKVGGPKYEFTASSEVFE
jgi:hypothetical protein